MYGIADSKFLITVAPQNEMITVNCLIDILVINLFWNFSGGSLKGNVLTIVDLFHIAFSLHGTITFHVEIHNEDEIFRNIQSNTTWMQLLWPHLSCI